VILWPDQFRVFLSRLTLRCGASKTLDYSVDSPFFLAAASILLLVAILVLNGEYSTSVKFFNIKTLLW